MSTNNRPAEGGRHTGRVVNVKESLVSVDVSAIPVKKNEVGYILLGDERLKSEVLRIRSGIADLQVFEDTTGVKVGDSVEFSNEMLSVVLGPGLLGSVFDGLENPLAALAKDHGFFLPRGVAADPVDMSRKWDFKASVKVGDRVAAGDPIGSVAEGHINHKIMVPFDEYEPLSVTWVQEGVFTPDETVARAQRSDGTDVALKMVQHWPVKRALPAGMLSRRMVERVYPQERMTTSQRIIDTFFPIARGGTACIPGPFGAGKTVLQSAIARHSAVDVVIIIACGERAGEVVETIEEYPQTPDPRTGGSLMERTIIICNTSSMPVASREASIYTGITIGEYYRQMGLNVLCIADSTSRWAQAMRETSGRMEEIPGEEAFPANLDSSIKGIYERAGVLKCRDGAEGSLTFIGTVSPAGGNFEEPVTQATLATVKSFLGLSSERAYRRFYPAIDPLMSWSRYVDQLTPWFDAELGPQWVPTVKAFSDLLEEGDTIYQMMQVTGEEGISLEDFVRWQKSMLVDMVYLQQDAFDDVDASMPTERQKQSFELLKSFVDASYEFPDKDAARDFFTKLTGLYKNWNYAAPDSPEFERYQTQMAELARGFQVNAEAAPAE